MHANRVRGLAAAAFAAWLLAPAGAHAGTVWVHPALAPPPLPGGSAGLGLASSRARAVRLLHVRDAHRLEARRTLDAFARERVLSGESLHVRMRGAPADVVSLEARSLLAEQRAAERELADLVALSVRRGWRLGPTTRRVLLEGRIALSEAERLDEVARRSEVLEREVSRREAEPRWQRPGSVR